MVILVQVKVAEVRLPLLRSPLLAGGRLRRMRVPFEAGYRVHSAVSQRTS